MVIPLSDGCFFVQLFILVFAAAAAIVKQVHVIIILHVVASRGFILVQVDVGQAQLVGLAHEDCSESL